MQLLSVCVAAAMGALAQSAIGQEIDPFYAGSYTYTDLGSAPDVPSSYGGLTLLAGSTNTLLLGGSANTLSGMLYAVGVTRDGAGHINGFTGVTTTYAVAEYNDGGLTYGPGGVLFASRWPANELGQYRPGSTSPDRVINLAALGVADYHASIQFVRAGYAAVGRMKLCSWSGGEFYDATFAPDGVGTYSITGVQLRTILPGGPEGFVYVPIGSPLFPGPTMIVSEFSAGEVAAYDVDANGDPVVASRRAFMTGLSGAEGAFIDPTTGDFLFSTFGGGSRIIVVRGFVSIPSACSPADIATAGSSDPQAGPDGFVTGEDFDLFVLAYNTALERLTTGGFIADLTDGTGTGPPDGFITGTDFDFFVIAYFLGC